MSHLLTTNLDPPRIYTSNKYPVNTYKWWKCNVIMRNTYFNIGIYFDKPNNTSLTVVKWPRYTLNITLPDMQTRSILLAQRIVHQAYRIDFHTKSPHNTNIGLL